MYLTLRSSCRSFSVCEISRESVSSLSLATLNFSCLSMVSRSPLLSFATCETAPCRLFISPSSCSLRGFAFFASYQKRAASATSLPRRVSSSTNLLYPPSCRVLGEGNRLISSSPRPSQKFSSSLVPSWTSSLFCK